MSNDHAVPDFRLCFSLSEVSTLADAYGYPGEGEVVRDVAPRVRRQGYLTKEQFCVICEWKTKRSRRRCQSNTEDFVQSVTSSALTTQNERLRIEVLTLLTGVAWPTASTILHFCAEDRYPILDFRALWSLNVDVPKAYTFEFWWAYTLFCRRLADDAGADMRTLDRALWQFSSENQPPQTSSVVLPSIKPPELDQPSRIHV